MLDTQNKQTENKTLTRFQQHKEKRASMIVAQVIISESELAEVIPTYNSAFEYAKPEEFKLILKQLGMDIDQKYERQDGVRHRNRLNQIVFCSRWVGQELQTANWINSGYASREAIDKYSGSKILEDLYRERSATIDTQEYLESRDKHSVIDESVWTE